MLSQVLDANFPLQYSKKVFRLAMVANVVTKFGLTLMKLMGENENSICVWSCVKKTSKCHNFCNFWQIAKKVTAV